MTVSAKQRAALPASRMGIPSENKYPMPDRQHATLAKSYAARDATPAQRSEIDAKANAILHEPVKHTGKRGFD